LENDKVKIVEIRLAPGENLPMHTHGAYVSYTMNPCKVKFTLQDGTVREQEFEKGFARYSDGVTHALENVGSTDIFNLDIELKSEKKTP
jgi:beta-alanine degradation protein BauB